MHRLVREVGARRHHAAPRRAAVGPGVARLLGARVRGVQMGRPRLPNVSLAPPQGEPFGLPKAEAGAVVAVVVLGAAAVVGPGARPGARGVGGVEAPDAPPVLALAGEDVEVEVGRRAPPQVLPVPPVVLRAVATPGGVVPLAAADGVVVDRDPHERPFDVAVPLADAVPSHAAAPPVVPRVAPVGVLVVGREVAPLLVGVAHAAEVAHLPSVRLGCFALVGEGGGRVTGAVAIAVAA